MTTYLQNNCLSLCRQALRDLCKFIFTYLFILALRPGYGTWPGGYKTFFMLNSVEHEIFPAHKC